MFNPALVEAIAERNVHIREMLELKQLADKHGITSRAATLLEGWVDDWAKKNPHQFKLLEERVRINRIKESQS